MDMMYRMMEDVKDKLEEHRALFEKKLEGSDRERESMRKQSNQLLAQGSSPTATMPPRDQPTPSQATKTWAQAADQGKKNGKPKRPPQPANTPRTKTKANVVYIKCQNKEELVEFQPQVIASKINEEQDRRIVCAIEVTSRGNYKVHLTEEEEASPEQVQEWQGYFPGGDGILDTSLWHFGVVHGVNRDCSMEELRSQIAKWNKYEGQKVELAAEPRTLVPLDRETPGSLQRSVVIAFKTKDELKYFMKQKIHANYLVYTVRRFRRKSGAKKRSSRQAAKARTKRA
jgi:hypothetical protein